MRKFSPIDLHPKFRIQRSKLARADHEAQFVFTRATCCTQGPESWPCGMGKPDRTVGRRKYRFVIKKPGPVTGPSVTGQDRLHLFGTCPFFRSAVFFVSKEASGFCSERSVGSPATETEGSTRIESGFLKRQALCVWRKKRSPSSRFSDVRFFPFLMKNLARHPAVSKHQLAFHGLSSSRQCNAHEK